MNAHRLQTVVAIACLVTSLIAPAAFAAKHVLKNLNSLTVVDAHGKKVGKLLTVSPNGGMLAFEVDRQPFLLNLFQQDLSGTSAIWYDSSEAHV